MNLEFDHLGVIVKSIEKEIPIYQRLGYFQECEIFKNENQQMIGVFLDLKTSVKIASGGGFRIELIEDYSESRWLKLLLNTECGRVYHIAYKVENLEENFEKILVELKARVLSPIKPSTYFKNTCFLMLSNLQIIELVEY